MEFFFKDKYDYCYHEESQLLIKRGNTITTPKCEEVSCWPDYSIQINGCGTYDILDPSCKRWERDLTKPYPNCCNEFICVEKSDYLELDADSIKSNQL